MQISRYVNNEKYSQSNSSGFVKKLKTFALLFSPISIGCTASQQTQRIWPKGKIVFLQTRLFFFNKRQLLTNSWLLSRSYVRENNDSSKGLGFPFQLSLSFDFCLDEKPLKIPRKKTNWNLNNEDRLLNCYPLRDHIKRKGGAAIPPGNAQVGSHPVKKRPAFQKIHEIIPKSFSSHERVREDGDAGPGQASHRFTVVRCVLNYLQSKQ